MSERKLITEGGAEMVEALGQGLTARHPLRQGSEFFDREVSEGRATEAFGNGLGGLFHGIEEDAARRDLLAGGGLRRGEDIEEGHLGHHDTDQAKEVVRLVKVLHPDVLGAYQGREGVVGGHRRKILKEK
jgi:hypothetical protein